MLEPKGSKLYQERQKRVDAHHEYIQSLRQRVLDCFDSAQDKDPLYKPRVAVTTGPDNEHTGTQYHVYVSADNDYAPLNLRTLEKLVDAFETSDFSLEHYHKEGYCHATADPVYIRMLAPSPDSSITAYTHHFSYKVCSN